MLFTHHILLFGRRF